MNAVQVFATIISCMEEDNGCVFPFTDDQSRRALAPIETLQAAGFFEDDPGDLDGSFWQAAGGEYSEVREFFNIELEAFEELAKVLEEIFEGSD